jgi:hypothetical protein
MNPDSRYGLGRRLLAMNWTCVHAHAANEASCVFRFARKH